MPLLSRPNVWLRASAVVAAFFTLVAYAAEPKPLRALLVAGGCCHDYAQQHELLARGIQARANVQVDVVWTDHKGTKPEFPLYSKPGWAAGYDVVIHDECAAAVNDPEIVRAILKPHLEGLPAVALHCAMHSFRVASDFAKPQVPNSPGAMWFEFLGLQSSGHGPQAPLAIRYTADKHPITTGLADWTTGNEELYNNVQPPSVFAAHRSLATARQKATDKAGVTQEREAVVAWTNEYGPQQARVFATTVGHNNDTVADPRYLDLVTRGVLWTCDKLEPAYLKPFRGQNKVTFIKASPEDSQPKAKKATTKAG